MTKEGMNPTDAEIEKAILRGAEIAGEEARKGLGLPPEKPAIAAASVSEKPSVISSSDKGKEGKPKRQTRRRAADKNPPKPSKKGIKPGIDMAAEEKKVEEKLAIAGFPEWGVARDSVFESRTIVAAVPDQAVVTEAVLGSQEMVSTVAPSAIQEEVVADPAVSAAQAAEAASARLEQIQEEEGSIEAPARAEAAVSSEEAPVVEMVEADPLKKLKDEVAELRKKYAERQYEHGRMVESLKRSPIGRFLGGSDADVQDLEYWKTEYEAKLSELREAELGGIKERGLKGQELKDAMAGLLRASKVDETLALIESRDAYRLEGKHLTDKAYNAFRSVTEGYNKLSPKTKIMAGVAVGALALGSVGMGAAYLAVGAKLARRLVSGAGFAVAIDAKLDARTIERLKKQAEDEIEAELAEIFGPTDVSPEGNAPIERTGEEMLGMFEERLKAASGEADPAFQRLLEERRINVLMGAAAGTLAGFVGSAAAEWFHESGAAHTMAHATEEAFLGWDPTDAEHATMAAPVSGALPQELLDAQHETEVKAATEYVHGTPEVQERIREVTGMTDGQLRAIAAEQAGAAETSWAAMDEKGVIDESKLTPEEQQALEVETGGSARESVDMHSRMDFVEVPPEAGAEIPTVVTEELKAEMAAEFQPRADAWFDQIFRVDDESIGSGHDWVVDREKLGKTKISDMVHDAVLYQRGETSGYWTGLSAGQLKNFAQFFMDFSASMDQGDQKILAAVKADLMRSGGDTTVMEYLKKIAPLAKQGQRFGLFTTSV